MGSVRIINLSKSVYDDNDRRADELRAELRAKGVFLVNVMSSPGAGKTTTLISLINRLSARFRIGVMEADIDSERRGCCLQLPQKADCWQATVAPYRAD